MIPAADDGLADDLLEYRITKTAIIIFSLRTLNTLGCLKKYSYVPLMVDETSCDKNGVRHLELKRIVSKTSINRTSN